MSKAALVHLLAPSDSRSIGFLDATTDSFARQLRSPILHASSPVRSIREK